MLALIGLCAVIGFSIAVGARYQPKQSAFQAAFGTTAMAALFLVAGTIGFTIEKSNWSLVSGRWSDGVVWWEIRLGLIALIFAVYFWRKALRSLG